MLPHFLLVLLSLPFFTAVNAQELETSLKSPLPAQGRDDAVGFAIAQRGYILGGRQSNFAISAELWEYAPLTDTWELKSPLPGSSRQYSSSWSMSDSACVIGGYSDRDIVLDELWCYTPATDTWRAFAPFGGGPRYGGVAFELKGRYYYGLGRHGEEYYSDIWEYVSEDNTWVWRVDLPVPLQQAALIPFVDHVVIAGGRSAEEVYHQRAWTYDGEGLTEIKPMDSPLAFGDGLHIGTSPIIIGGQTESSPDVQGYLQLKEHIDIHGNTSYQWQRMPEMADGPKQNGAVFQLGDTGYYFGGKDANGVKSNALVAFTPKPIESDISVYPIPADEQITVLCNGGCQLLTLFDLRGRVLMKVETRGTYAKLDLSMLPAGVYLLRTQESVTRILRQ